MRVVRITRVAAVLASTLATLAALVSCQAGQRGPSRVEQSATVLHPSPAPSGYEWGVPPERIDRALLDDGDLQGVPVSFKADFFGDDLLSPCGLLEVEKQWPTIGQLKEWQGAPIALFVVQYVRPFWWSRQVLAAADVIAEVRRKTTCTTYSSREGVPRLAGELSLPTYPGIDAQYAFCERIDRNGDDAWGACTVFLGRGEIVSRVRVRAESENRAKELIPAVAAAAAKALARA